MSCDSYAGRVINTLVSIGGGSSLDASHLLTVYDVPPTLQPGEDAARLRAEAKLLLVDLQRRGISPPDHLNLDSKSSKVYIRLGRLGTALREQGFRGTRQRPGRAPMAYDHARRDYIRKVLVTPELAAFFESREAAELALEEVYRVGAMPTTAFGMSLNGPSAWMMAEKGAKGEGIVLYPHLGRLGQPPAPVMRGVAAMVQTAEAIQQARATGGNPFNGMPTFAQGIVAGWVGRGDEEAALPILPPHVPLAQRPPVRDNPKALSQLSLDLWDHLIENPQVAETLFAYSDGKDADEAIVDQAVHATTTMLSHFRPWLNKARTSSYDIRGGTMDESHGAVVIAALLGGDGSPTPDRRAVLTAALNLSGNFACPQCAQRRGYDHTCPPDATTPAQRVAQYREELRPVGAMIAELDALDAEQGTSWRDTVRAMLGGRQYALSKQARHAWNRVLGSLAFRTDIPAMTRARLTCSSGVKEIAQALLGEEVSA